ncbi:MAG: winged helix-turn-helix transcriptional regulator [Rhodospirillales bacterium]|nr:winged helix-turn-helix transcriptional regulator [Rhodospirillales bacterium]
MHKNADKATDLLKALASRNRLLILCHLLDGEKTVGELAGLLELRHAAASQQLSLLRKDGLVTGRRDKQTIYYSLASDEAEQVLAVLHKGFCEPPKKKNRKSGNPRAKPFPCFPV